MRAFSQPKPQACRRAHRSMTGCLLKYFGLTLKHKWFVLQAGVLWSKAPLWQLIIHDWSKFTPSEAPHYARGWFGDHDRDSESFATAWNHHHKRNKHHWEYWVPVTGHSKSRWKGGDPLPIPERFVREMVADWLGSHRTANPDYPESLETWAWWQKNQSEIRLHPDSRALLMTVLQETFDRRNRKTQNP